MGPDSVKAKGKDAWFEQSFHPGLFGNVSTSSGSNRAGGSGGGHHRGGGGHNSGGAGGNRGFNGLVENGDDSRELLSLTKVPAPTKMVMIRKMIPLKRYLFEIFRFSFYGLFL